MAAKIFGKAPHEVTKLDRYLGKTTVHAAQREQFVAATRSVYTKWKPQVGAPLVDKAEKALAAVK